MGAMGKPSVDIPWLRKLGEEVEKAAQAIVGHESSTRWWDMYRDRANPEFSRLSEASLLNLFRKQVGLHMEVALFDGAYLQCNTLAEDVRMRQCFRKAAENFIPVEMESPPPHVQGFARLLDPVEVTLDPDLPEMRFENCLLNELRFVSPDMDLSTLVDQLQATPDAGLSANDLNSAALYGSQRAEPCCAPPCRH